VSFFAAYLRAQAYFGTVRPGTGVITICGFLLASSSAVSRYAFEYDKTCWGGKAEFSRFNYGDMNIWYRKDLTLAVFRFTTVIVEK
jgi:hypothetical protein